MLAVKGAVEGVSGLVDDGMVSRLLRWELQDAARGLLGSDSRVCRCHRVAVPEHISGGIKAYRREDKGTYYSGLMMCASVWACPVCAAKIAMRRREDLAQVYDTVMFGSGGAYHILLTIPHQRVDDVSYTVDELLSAFRSLTSGRWSFYNLLEFYLGTVRALEVTHSDTNGWHPHLHVLVFTEKPLTSEELDAVREKLYTRWQSLMKKLGKETSKKAFSFEPARNGYEIKDVSKDSAGNYQHKCPVTGYITKFGADKELEEIVRTRRWGVVDELTRGNVKKKGRGGSKSPMELLYEYAVEGNERSGALWVEYAKAFKGRSSLQWSRGLRKSLGLDDEKTDAELAETVDAKDELVAKISTEDWKIIKRYNLRGDVLEILRDHDYSAVERLLSIFTKKEEKT